MSARNARAEKLGRRDVLKTHLLLVSVTSKTLAAMIKIFTAPGIKQVRRDAVDAAARPACGPTPSRPTFSTLESSNTTPISKRDVSFISGPSSTTTGPRSGPTPLVEVSDCARCRLDCVLTNHVALTAPPSNDTEMAQEGDANTPAVREYLPVFVHVTRY